MSSDWSRKRCPSRKKSLKEVSKNVYRSKLRLFSTHGVWVWIFRRMRKWILPLPVNTTRRNERQIFNMGGGDLVSFKLKYRAIELLWSIFENILMGIVCYLTLFSVLNRIWRRAGIHKRYEMWKKCGKQSKRLKRRRKRSTSYERNWRKRGLEKGCRDMQWSKE